VVTCIATGASKPEELGQDVDERLVMHPDRGLLSHQAASFVFGYQTSRFVSDKLEAGSEM